MIGHDVWIRRDILEKSLTPELTHSFEDVAAHLLEIDREHRGEILAQALELARTIEEPPDDRGGDTQHVDSVRLLMVEDGFAIELYADDGRMMGRRERPIDALGCQKWFHLGQSFAVSRSMREVICLHASARSPLVNR